MADDMRAGARAYQEIKKSILSGELRLRQRLEIELLAKRFRVSATPVRQALAILTAERLVSAGGARGYRVTFWSERDLKELYQWRADLADLAARSVTPQRMPSDLLSRSHGEVFAGLMRILEAGAHMELKRAARQADDRLSAAVRAEAQVLSAARAELAGLVEALEQGEQAALRSRLSSYFSARIEHCAAIRAAAHASATPSNGD